MTDTPRPERDTTTFAQETRLRANEVLTELSAQRTSIAGQIEQLRLQLESVGRQEYEAQVVLDALDGKLVHTDDASRFEPPEAEPRARWEEPPYDPEYLECARSFVATRDGSFTVKNLGADLREAFPSAHIPDETVDAILSTLLSGNEVHLHSADDFNPTRYIAPPKPPTTTELESGRSEEGGVQPKSESAPVDEEEGETPSEVETPDGEVEEESVVEQPDDESAAPVLPMASGVDRMAVIDDAVAEHLRDYPRSTRQSVMEACTLTDSAASRSLARLVRAERAMIVSENPTCWSLAPGVESVTPPPDEPEPVEPQAEEQEPATDGRESRRGGDGYLSVEVVRDAAKQMGEKFNARTLAAWMTENLDIGEVHGPSLRRYVRELEGKGTLTRHGGKAGPGVKYEYVKPNGGGPTHRPRHDHPRQAPKGAETPERGEAVPHSGRARGRSGKQGENKKKQALGFRVKSARTDRKRAG